MKLLQRRAFYLLATICILSWCACSLRAEAQQVQSDIVRHKDLIESTQATLEELKAQLITIKMTLGGVVGALCGAVGMLFRTLVATHGKMIDILEKESITRAETIKAVTTSVSEVTHQLGEVTEKLASLKDVLDHPKGKRA